MRLQEFLGRIFMAESESTSQEPTVLETPSNQLPSIALSEENLAALLGLAAPPKAGSEDGGSFEPPLATPPMAENVESGLASLAAAQETRMEHPQPGGGPV